MTSFKFRAKQTTSTTGTGTITLGSAATQYQALGSTDNGKVFAYSIESGDGSSWEEGYGLYTHSGTTLTRVLVSSSTGSLINLSGTSTVMLTPLASHFGDQVTNIKARVLATSSVTLATDLENGDTLNGVTLATGDIVFTPNQSTAADRRVWIVKASGAPDPHPLMPAGAVISQFLVTVSEGTSQKDSIWLQTANTVTVGSGNLTWSWINQSTADQVANTVNAGPTSGSDAPPTYRALVYSDIPDLSQQYHNLLINGAMEVCQRMVDPLTGVSVADDTYMGPDRFYLLTSASSGLVSRQTGSTNRYSFYISNDSGGNARYAGCQIVSVANSFPMRGKTMIAQARLKCSQTKNLRIALLEWTGTADSVTSDVVNNWSSSTFTTGNFFNSTTLTLVGTAQLAATANTWGDISVSGAVSSSCNNLIWMVWTEDFISSSATFQFECPFLGRGSSVVPWYPRIAESEKHACYEYLEAVFAEGATCYLTGFNNGTNQRRTHFLPFKSRKRIIPTGSHNITGYSATAPGSKQLGIYDFVAAAQQTISGALTMGITAYNREQYLITATAGTSFTGTSGNPCSLQFGTDTILLFDAEL